MWTRRQLLTTGALGGVGAVALSTSAMAIGPTSEVSMGAIAHGGSWDHRPDGIRRLLWETGKRTSINTARERAVVRLDDDGSTESKELFRQPLLVLAGEGPMPPWSDNARARLERHLRFGGLLFVDAPSPSDPFREAHASVS